MAKAEVDGNVLMDLLHVLTARINGLQRICETLLQRIDNLECTARDQALEINHAYYLISAKPATGSDAQLQQPWPKPEPQERTINHTNHPQFREDGSQLLNIDYWSGQPIYGIQDMGG